MSNAGKHYQPRNLKNASSIQFEKIFIRPRNNTEFTSTNGQREIDFYLPRKGSLMGIRSGLSCKTNITGGNLSLLQDVFSRMEVWISNKKIIDEKNFNKYRRLQFRAYTKGDQTDSITIKRMGLGQAAVDSTDYYKYMPLAHPVFNSRGLFSEILPLREIGQVHIRFTIDDNLLTEVCGGSGSAYSFTDLKLFLHLVDSPQIRSNFKNITREIETYHSLSHQESSASSISHRISGNYSNAKFVIATINKNSDIGLGVTANGVELDDAFDNQSADKFYLTIDGEKIGNGSLEIRTTDNSELAEQLCECWKPKDWILGSFYSDLADTSKFYLGVNLSQENRAIAGKNLAGSTGVMSFDIDTISVSELSTFRYYVVYSKFVKIAGGNVSVTN